MLKLKLHWQILIGFLTAILIGLYLTEYVEYITWMGDLFLRALKMIIVPLILSSIDLLKPRSDPTPGCKRLTKSNPTIIAKVLVDK